MAKSAPPGDESFKDLNISTIQIPYASLETMARLGVEQFPHVTNWNQKVSQLVLPVNSEFRSNDATSATASSTKGGNTNLAEKEAPSSSNALDNT